MSKEESIQVALTSIEAALGALYDSGVSAGAGQAGSFSQQQLDDAVAQAKAADALALADAVAAVQIKLDEVVAEDVVEDALMAQLQAKIDQIKALLA